MAIIDDLGAQSVHVCGESAGGMAAIALAALHPQRVRTLTLVSTPVSIPAERRVTYGMTGVSGETDRDAYIEATNRSMRFPPDADPGLLDWYKREFQKNRADVQAAMAAGLVNSATCCLSRTAAGALLGLIRSLARSRRRENICSRPHQNVRCRAPGTFHKVRSCTLRRARSRLHFAAQHDGSACHELERLSLA